MKRHGIQRSKGSGTVWIGLRRRYKPASNGVLLDIAHATHELLCAHDLALVKTTHPHIELAFKTKREAAFDELHCLFERNIGSGRDQCVEMVRHDDESMQKKFVLAAIVEDGALKQLRRGRDLKKAAALRRHSGYQIGPGFLRRESHVERINEGPVAKAIRLARLYSGA